MADIIPFFFSILISSLKKANKTNPFVIITIIIIKFMIPHLPAFVKSKISTADLFLHTAVLVLLYLILMDTNHYLRFYFPLSSHTFRKLFTTVSINCISSSEHPFTSCISFSFKSEIFVRS